MGQGTTVPRCSKCGRVLKSPESIARGIGPECAGLRGYARSNKLGIRHGRRGAYAAGDSSSGSGEPAVPVVHDDDLLDTESVADGVEDGEK